MVHLFVDTNIFLHFIFFEEIPWRSLVDDVDFKVTIAPIVLDELDKHKRSPKQKIASRAKTVLAKIEAEMTHPDSSNLELIHRRPNEKTFEAYHLDRNEQDDQLLATIIEFQAAGADCRLVTNDTGPALRARSVGVKIIKLDGTFLLPTEKTEEEQELLRLQKELNALKNAHPKLHLRFDNDSEFIQFELEGFNEIKDLVVESQLVNEKRRLPQLTFLTTEARARKAAHKIPGAITNIEKLLATTAVARGFTELSQDQVDRYNRALNEYYNDFSSYLEKRYEYERVKAMSLPLRLLLKNIGTAPAEDVDILLHFPDSIVILHEDELPDNPKLPTPPYKPKNSFDRGDLPSINPIAYFHRVGIGDSFELPDPDRPNSEDKQLRSDITSAVTKTSPIL